MTKVERHAELCKEINALYAKKNHDYGDSFHEMFLEEGWASARIRLTDKLKRFKQLTRNPNGQQVKDESVRKMICWLVSNRSVLMNNEQLFWMSVIVLLNIAAYLVGRHDGTRYGRENTIAVLLEVAPDEMAMIKKKFDNFDPFRFLLERMKEEGK